MPVSFTAPGPTPLGKTLRLALAALSAWALSASPLPAVIDCSRATSNADRLVCSSDRLAAAEESMARAFRAAMRRGVDPQMLRSTQRVWKSQVRDACSDAPCLERAYLERLSQLDAY